MDVVYVLKKGKTSYQEFRYSLRSLSNIEHDKVFVIGYAPERVRNITLILFDDKYNKYKNVKEKYKKICKDKRISEDFIFMHDDFYLLQKIEKIDYYIMCSLKEHRDYIKMRVGENNYFKAIDGAYKQYPDGDSFEVHCPIVFNKSKLSKILKKYEGIRGSRRSLYCNEYNIKGKTLPNMPKKPLIDCKINNSMKFIVGPNWTYLSSSDRLSKNIRFHTYMKNKFGNKCKYER